MNALTRKLATVGSALAMAASSLLLASSPASAATSCYASSCEGLDPATTICQNDARTVAETYFPGGIELRYSPTCRTAWARYNGTLAMNFTVMVERENADGSYSPHYSAYYYGNGAGVWTRMVNDAGITARACGYASGGYSCSRAY
ncbi:MULTISPECIES: DUF2690 domain-containing protein [Streptomyces]|uniref:DUF2690 domain-containing protein n=1 Tax=Streptomyces TaxID=1883 RepID=UPI000466F0BB|nr:DUF2690 domain-containing protein [Streptomyces exfoliatus]